MNILYINHYAGSLQHGMEYRPYYLAREWARSGHDVRILAGAFSHLRGAQPTADGDTISKRSEEHIDGIKYFWYPTPIYGANGLGRALNISKFLLGVWIDAKRLVGESKPDVVIASSTYPLDIWVARRLKKLSKAKLIYEVHDLWPLSPIELGGMSPHHPFIQLCQWAENTAYRVSDAVVSMLPMVHEHMGAHGLDLRKLHIIPNGISEDEWKGAPPPIPNELAEYLHAVHSQGNLLVGYTGSHGLSNALDFLLDAAKLLSHKPIRFVLVGDGQEKARLQRRLTEEKMDNVRMFKAIPKTQIPSLLHDVDIAYLGWKRSPLYRFGIAPNKLLDYMMAGCAILHSVEAGNDPVAAAACGLTVPPESPQAIADGLLKLTGLTVTELRTMGSKGRSYVQAVHTYPDLARKFLSIMRG